MMARIGNMTSKATPLVQSDRRLVRVGREADWVVGKYDKGINTIDDPKEGNDGKGEG